MDKNELQRDDLLLNYHQYLLKKSIKGDLYRKFLLYPAINNHLKGRALDIGCGVGKFLRFRKNTVGIDVNPYNIEYCKKQGFEAQLVGEASWPFPIDTFDSAILDNVLEHLTDPFPLLLQIRNVLKHAGVLVIGVPGPVGFAHDSDHKVFYPDEKLKDLMESIGFQRINLFHMPIRSKYLEQKMYQYCYYSVFQKN